MATERRKDNKRRVLKEGEYQRKNGTYEYKWSDRTGKRHSIYAKSLDELRACEEEQMKDTLDGLRVCKKDLTINDVYEWWVNNKRGLKDNTFQNYQYMYTQFVEPDFGKKRVWNLKRTDVRAFYNRLSDEQHLKTSTIDCVHTVLHQVLEIAVEDDYIRYNPSDKALTELKRAHVGDSDKRRALTEDEQELLERYLKGNEEYKKWWPIFTFMLWTGCIVGETTGLRWSDVSFEDETISINHTLVYYDKHKQDGMTYAINTPKTKNSNRIIPMLPIVKEALLQEKKNQEEAGTKCEVTVDGYTGFVFVNRFGSVQHQGTLNRALRRIIRDCNYEQFDKHEGEDSILLLPKFSNHSLRHTFTTRMCEAGVNIKVMQAILGHADAETTMDIYADATKKFQRKEIVRIE